MVLSQALAEGYNCLVDRTLATREIFVPIPDLIEDIVASARHALTEELGDIVQWAATLSFSDRLVRPDPLLIGRTYRGSAITTEMRLPSVEAHLLKRIHVEKQWPPETTTAQYVADLHKAIQHSEARIWTYRLFSLPFVGFLSPCHVKDAPKPEPFIYVACNAYDQRITTGYQASGIQAIPALTKLAEQLIAQR